MSQPTLWGHASRVPGRGWRGTPPLRSPLEARTRAEVTGGWLARSCVLAARQGRGSRGRARAHPAGRAHRQQSQPDRPVGEYPQGGGRGRRGDRPPGPHRAGAPGTGPRRRPRSRCTLSSWPAEPARRGTRPTTSSGSGTRPDSRARASRCCGGIPIKWLRWLTRWRSSTSTPRA